jgi:chemotaxis protein histidine kinase CheA
MHATMRNTMKYSLADAAKATGKNKTTIQRAIKSGKISGVKGASGAYEIDPAELHRVFPPATTQRDAQQAASNDMQRPTVALETNGLERIAELEKELAVAQSRSISLEEQRQQMSETIEDLRGRLDRSEERVTALLMAPPQKRRGWWPWGRS